MVSTQDEDSYDYFDDGFDNYEPKTIAPGPWMLIGVSIYSILCVVILPFLVVLGNKRDKKRIHRGTWEDDDSIDSIVESSSHHPPAVHRKHINTEKREKTPSATIGEPPLVSCLKITHKHFSFLIIPWILLTVNLFLIPPTAKK